MNHPTTAYLLLGSNLEDKVDMLKKAVVALQNANCNVKAQSGYYLTEAWGVRDQPDFVNQAIEIETDFTPAELLRRVLSIETKFGRVREEGKQWQPRTIDIDILLYGDTLVKTNHLEIPHPRMKERNFVLLPLMEIAPELIHPTLKKTIEDLYMESDDESEVLRMEDI
jgi:2-amino-4-hydroxy-6-hydroxymethyldihydropteridine diphosphokinase